MSRFPEWVPKGRVALRTVDIAKWIYRHMPHRFTSRDVADQFRIERGEANRRIRYLITYGLVRLQGYASTHKPGRREKEYTLTAWGERYGRDQTGRRARGKKSANPDGDSHLQ